MGDVSERSLDALHREIRTLRWSLISLAVVVGGALVWLALKPTELPAVIAAERLDIIEPDGRLAFVLANSQRPVPATINGQTVMAGQEEERRMPSIMFFDGKGDEVGGMLFASSESEGGAVATRHLSFDALEQDQTIVLSHRQDARGSTAGLTISDRPAHSLLETFAMLGLQPGATRAELVAALGAIAEDQRAARRRELFGSERAFFGAARDGTARLELRDGEGRPRLVLEAPKDGASSIRLLDESGAVLLSLPP
jgi:hypothetical protein